MFIFDHHLSTHAYLEEIKKHFSSDPRLEIYKELQQAVSKIDPFLFVTVTFATRVCDEVTCEGICRRITEQLQRAVVGKRKSSKISCFVILERGKGRPLHVHMLIGRVQGQTRSLKSTTFKNYIQKKPFSALLKILNRLTIPTNEDKISRVGFCHFRTVHSKEGAIDYMLKALKPNQLNIAWLASNIDFSGSSASVRPLRPKLST